MVELAFDRVDGAQPERTIAFFHGILGSGGNLRTIAKRFVAERPGYTAWLVDLRGHGRSPKRTPDPSLEAAARDVLDTTAFAKHPLAAIAGHSFGGKVALEVLRLGAPTLAHVVVVDANPGVREPLRGPGSALDVIETIERLAPSFPTKQAFVDALIAAGQPRTVAQWLAMSTTKKEGGHAFALDLAEIRALLLDYFRRDLWPVVESPPGASSVHLVIGGRSESFSPADRERAERAASGPRTTVDVLPTDHWVHAEDPDGLLRVLLDRLAP
jgi:pimeloyl-ACP methyl ester carboxylesterase